MTDFKKQGKKNRTAGKAFENKVRKDLETKGWTVSKWANNVDLKFKTDTVYIRVDPDVKVGTIGFANTTNRGRLIPAKPQFNPYFKRIVGEGSGFPDFVSFRSVNDLIGVYEVEGVECKINGILTKEEKEKCEWLLTNHIFSSILVASKGKKRGEIIYKEWNK